MKQTYYTLLILITTLPSFAQISMGAPWMNNETTTAHKTTNSKTEKLTFDTVVDKFNTYWLTHDKNTKGSGHKPFMRWQEHWKNYLEPDGTIAPASDLWSAWEEMNSLKASATDYLGEYESRWQSIGPWSHTNTKSSGGSGRGRVNAIAVDPSNPNVYYIGAPAGGLWKSSDSGTSWIPLTDYLPQIGVSGIAIDPNDSNTIYISTGDDDHSSSYSVGVFKSTNGGVTWSDTGLYALSGAGIDTNEIYIHPNNSNILWVASNRGVYKTLNAGASWTQTPILGGVKDLKLHPSNPNILYAVSRDKFYKSTNGGNTFSLITSQLPTSSTRLVIDVTPANSNYVYVLSANTDQSFQGIYKSTDSGNSFLKQDETFNILEASQAWYDLALAVSPTNPEEIYVGCLNVWKSSNGGDNFTKLNEWHTPSPSFTYADIHMLRFFNNALFCASDGGIYRSTNGGTNFTDLTENLAISQFYKIAVSKQTSSRMAGGLQDNGGFGYKDGDWLNWHSGDGMDTAIDPNNPNIYYGFTQYGGGLQISSNAGSSRTGGATNVGSGNWVTPLVVNSQGEVFSGTKTLNKLVGSSFQIAQSQVYSTPLEYIEVDPQNDNVIYTADNNYLNKVTFSPNGASHSPLYTFTSNITSIEVHNGNSNIIWVTTQGTNGKVSKSVDGGLSFTNITLNLPSLSKYIVIHQPDDINDPIYLGTSLGVFTYNNSLSEWRVFSDNLPNVPVRDLEINMVDRNITAATYGRGVWVSNLYEPVCSSLVINHSSPQSGFASFRAKTINSTSDITANSTITYVAQEKINLKPGFKVVAANAKFLGVIEACSLPLSIIPTNLPYIPGTNGFYEGTLPSETTSIESESNDSQINELLAYPNSTNGEITVAHIKGISVIELTNYFGQTYYQREVPNNAKRFTVDISSASSGLYFIKVTLLNGEIITKQVIKK